MQPITEEHNNLTLPEAYLYPSEDSRTSVKPPLEPLDYLPSRVALESTPCLFDDSIRAATSVSEEEEGGPIDPGGTQRHKLLANVFGNLPSVVFVATDQARMNVQQPAHFVLAVSGGEAKQAKRRDFQRSEPLYGRSMICICGGRCGALAGTWDFISRDLRPNFLKGSINLLEPKSYNK